MMKSIKILGKIGLPSGYLDNLPDPEKRSFDGVQYRFEVPEMIWVASPFYLQQEVPQLKRIAGILPKPMQNNGPNR